MEVTKLTSIEDFPNGDVIRVVSDERCCGIECGVFTMIVVDSKEYGLVAIHQDFLGWIARCAIHGVGWEITIENLLSWCDVYLLARYKELMEDDQLIQ